MFGMQLGSGSGMMFRMQVMALSGMGMISGRLDIFVVMIFGGLPVMLRCLFVMLRRLLVMFGNFSCVRH